MKAKLKLEPVKPKPDRPEVPMRGWMAMIGHLMAVEILKACPGKIWTDTPDGTPVERIDIIVNIPRDVNSLMPDDMAQVCLRPNAILFARRLRDFRTIQAIPDIGLLAAKSLAAGVMEDPNTGFKMIYRVGAGIDGSGTYEVQFTVFGSST